MTCVFYSPIIPQAIPAALVGCFLNYWVFKYMLLRKHKMPEMFSELMASFFANFMPWIVLTWAIAFLVFLSKISNSYEYLTEGYQDLNNMSDEEVKEFVISSTASAAPGAAIGIVVFCLILPVRSCISRLIDSDKALECDKNYVDIVETFPTDYDKENPLTIKQGQIRLLELQIKKAEASGDEDTVKMLQAQKENASSQGIFQ